jgi:hypothetical protein
LKKAKQTLLNNLTPAGQVKFEQKIYQIETLDNLIEKNQKISPKNEKIRQT